MNRELLKLLQEIRMERDFNTIAICQTSADDCIFDNVLKEISMPVVLLNKRLAYTYKAQFSKELLILLCLHQSSLAARLAELRVFRSLKQTRIVAYVPHVTDLVLVKQYCLDAMANDIYNVLIIQRDFSATQNYYTCNKFPLDAPRYKEKSLKRPGEISSAIFEQQFQNMYGTPILIYPDQLEPRSMLYYKPDGNVEVEGYIGRTLRVFAARRNTTLFINHPYKVGKSVFYGVLQELAENGTIDIAAGMTFVTPNDDLEKLSYPVQTMDYCYMVPLPENVPINQLFLAIVRFPMLLYIFVFIVIFAALLTLFNKSKQINFINLFLNDQSIRGMLGQSFVLAAQPSYKIKFIVFLLCFMSIITNTTYQAYLQSFFTHPPLLPMHHSYEDLEAAGLTILFPADELSVIKQNQSLLKHMHLVKMVPEYDAWLKRRSSLKTKYVFPVSSIRWEAFESQQRLFNRPIFYFNSDLCFFKTVPLSMPIRADLPYRDLLDDFVLRLHSSGIITIWVALNFFVMAKFKLIVIEDLSRPLDYGRPLVVDDFFWIQVQYIATFGILPCYNVRNQYEITTPSSCQKAYTQFVLLIKAAIIALHIYTLTAPALFWSLFTNLRSYSINQLLDLFLCVMDFIVVSFLGVRKTNKLIEILNKILKLDKSLARNNTPQHIDNFLAKTIKQKIEFTACGFIAINNNTFFQMLCGVTTYLIILIQFRQVQDEGSIIALQNYADDYYEDYNYEEYQQ
ncbi:PREDICTED: uncharacterized protein LOC108371992 [Rhagoletis zephyria]|uniref:uncharacterized protein LOC108371992 n=1 Tax=Rhagoletis zephyria TaxID=28612 RepID=UPI000811798F|nr:PREDICTED: uncharacterized protein LOC108371992 [Rhagoletis zephyria]